jgi:hypothetical protein
MTSWPASGWARPDKAIVQVSWKPVDAAGDGDMSGSAQGTVVRITSSSRMTTTKFDAKGKRIEVRYNPDPAKSGQVWSGAPPAGTKVYVADAPIFEPGDIVEIERSEVRSPWLLRKAYRRKLNADSIWGEKPRRFLMLGISGTAETFGTGASAAKPRLWRNTYSMEYRPPSPEGNGWDFTAVYVDSRTGQSPPDVNPENREFKNDGDEVKGTGVAPIHALHHGGLCTAEASRHSALAVLLPLLGGAPVPRLH